LLDFWGKYVKLIASAVLLVITISTYLLKKLLLMAKKIISAQEIVVKFHTPYQKINYYTAIGLLPVAAKVGNKRMYEEQVIKERLQKISELAREGYPLNLIRKKLVGM